MTPKLWCPCNTCEDARRILKSARNLADRCRREAAEASTDDARENLLRTAEEYDSFAACFVPDPCLKLQTPTVVGEPTAQGPIAYFRRGHRT